MFHLSSSSRSRSVARTVVLWLLAIAALAATAVSPAQARPLGPCDGPCSPPAPKPKLVTAYHDTYAYSTPYLNARSRHPLKATTYVATCEAYSSSSGPSGNRWWSRLREGTWVNNVDLRGGVKMDIGDCAAPPNDGQPKTVPVHPTLKPCHNSDWMSQAGGIGLGADFVVSMKPTLRARLIGDIGVNIRYIWRDLNRCVPFPKLLPSQSASLYKQLACHAMYAKHPQWGGPTWDLEAWRPNVSTAQALNPLNHCNWGSIHPEPEAPRSPPIPKTAGCTPANARFGVYKLDSTITAYGSFFNCSTKGYATMKLQRHRWYGWQTLRSTSRQFTPNSSSSLSYDCRGTGTYTYRTMMFGRTNGESPWVKKSTKIRKSC